MGAFKKATKSQAKLRAAVFGPSGSGKTFTSLRIATGLGGPIAVIDSERGSASKYADRFDFDVCDLDDKTIEGYSRIIREASKAGYNVLVIDSLSHAWQELLEQVDALAKTKYKGNTWSAWSEGTPKQRKLVDAILEYPGHVLATMRSKTERQTGEGRNGKTQPVRVGLAPEQGKGIEYEFDLLLEINPEHQATVLKDRTGKFQDRIMDRPGEDFGRDLAAWLDEGHPATSGDAGGNTTTETGPEPAAAPREGQDALGAARESASATKVAQRFESALNAFCQRMNARWADKHTDGDGVIPAWVKDIANPYQIVNHMLKEAKVELPKGGNFNERMKAASRLWLADEAGTVGGWRAYIKGLAEAAEQEHAGTEEPGELASAAANGREPGEDG